MKANHTQAPWIVQIDEDRNDSSFTTIKIVDGSSESLSHPQGALTLANIQTFAPHIKEGIANAHLISAAPDLLDLLKSAIARIQIANEEGESILSAWLPDAIAAIAKAEGKA
jgi:hypothetical protein